MSPCVAAQFIIAKQAEAKPLFNFLSFFFLTCHFDFQTNGPGKHCFGHLLSTTSCMTLIILAS